MCEVLPPPHQDAHAESRLPYGLKCASSFSLGARRRFHNTLDSLLSYYWIASNLELPINPEKQELNTQLPAFPGSIHRNWKKEQKSKSKISSFVL